MDIVAAQCLSGLMTRWSLFLETHCLARAPAAPQLWHSTSRQVNTSAFGAKHTQGMLFIANVICLFL